jgi:hypothetical protein
MGEIQAENTYENKDKSQSTGRPYYGFKDEQGVIAFFGTMMNINKLIFQ